MNIRIQNFGENLLNRPSGREAFLMAKAYIFKDIKPTEEIVLDFEEIKVMTPSWLDEFITGIKTEFNNELKYINTENPSVSASLKTILV
ncbi:hypothetical protein TREPR_2161 [Treponema primitia ZAS-2]|uniref:BRCT domain-containing protein n=1 Tax=Treponema primitia (strain ATCC BAA-887 / DSM 12427 / ZAS-2) TaxID=545694 RepID=F5YJ38_TREPZ|nr:STAS-like domain-containing protein [Treponema primitia]AEF83631.1 hypothetical protein TREPR_2161 [Treponema primitia ZAS-2]